MLGIDKRRDAALFLGLGDDVQAERGFAGAFRAEDFDDAAPRHALAAQGDIQRDRAGRNPLDLQRGVAIHVHDGALAVGLFDLGEGPFQGLIAERIAAVGGGVAIRR